MSRYNILMTSFAVNLASSLGVGALGIAEVEIPMPYKVAAAIIILTHMATNYVLAREGWWKEDDK